MFTSFSEIRQHVSGFLLKTHSKWLYQFIARRTQPEHLRFMNYGYALLNDEEDRFELQSEDEFYRYPIQLYHHVASAIELAGLDVLEVGSGRGGGSDFVKRYLHPRSMVGMDLSKNAVNCASKTYNVEGLSFRAGDAEHLPFLDSCFDAVINIESSHCYPSVETFLREVKRVLRNGGYFLYADLRRPAGVKPLDEILGACGMEILHRKDITANVVAALDLDNDRKQKILLKETKNKFERKQFGEIAAIKGSRNYDDFKNGNWVYQSFVMRKSEH
jgi:ubiquinone/menaquinone biosynthesis C-methylase UbiE